MGAEPSRSELHAKAAEFIASAGFERYYYYRAHMPKAQWITGQLLRCATLIGLRGGLDGLASTHKQLFDTPALKARYRALPAQGVVVRGFVTINHGVLDANPEGAGPALVVASLEGTTEGDAAAQAVWEHVVERVLLGHPETSVDKTLAAQVADEEYTATRRRPIPAELGDHALYFLDVWIDNRLLGGSLLGHADRQSAGLYFLVDPRPSGLSLLVPRVDPAAHGMDKGRP